MAYDEGLAERIRDAIPRGVAWTERKMFGGVCFLDRGNMMCGIVDDRLMLRFTKEEVGRHLKEPHTAPMDFTGRPMASMMYVEPEGIADDDQLRAWLERAAAFTRTLPAK